MRVLLIFFIFFSSLIASTKDRVSVQLLWKHQFEFAGFYMAKKMGYYDEVNLDVTLKEYQVGTNITKEVEEEKSTFGIAYPSILLDRSKGAKIVLLNAMFQNSPHILVSLQKSGIKEFKDFKGKKVMIEDDAIKNAPLLSMLFSHGLSMQDIKLVKPTFNIDDLIEGKVDIVASYKSNELYKLDELGIKYNIFDPKDYGFDFYNDFIFTSQKMIDKNPELVSRFQRATLKGWEYAFAHINETIQVIQDSYNTQNKSHKALSYEAKVLKSLAYSSDVTMGNIDERKLKRIQDIYGLMGLMKDDIDLKEFVFDGKKAYLTSQEKQFLANNIFTVSVSEDWKPFSFASDDKRAAGISSEYWFMIADQLGIKAKYQFFNTFTDQLNAVKSKEADLLLSAGKTKDREEYALFTEKYLTFPISIATSKEEEFIEDFSQISNKKIAVGKNFTAHKLLQEKYPQTNFVFVSGVKEGLELVNKGEVYAIVELKPILSYQIKKYKYDNIKISGNTGVVFDLSIMIRKDYPLLQSILNKEIDIIDPEKVNQLVKRYENIEFEQESDYGIFYQIFIVIGLLVLLILFRQYILNKANKNLKTLVEAKTRKLKELNETLEVRVEEAILENKSKDVILFQQSKMASMGEMIGNIAHQWRQPLSVISTSATGLNFKFEYGLDVPKEEVIATLEKVNQTAQFLSKTIDDFQNYLKPQQLNEKFNVKDVVEKNLELFGQAFINNDIKIVLDLDDVMINSSQNELLQVTINILNNAKDALKEFRVDDRYLFVSVYQEENAAIISIKDNAGGIPEDVIDKIFDAYFTTKHKSQGTGLGLYMSYQIITNRFHGVIDASNEEYAYGEKHYKGANFKIIIPITLLDNDTNE